MRETNTQKIFRRKKTIKWLRSIRKGSLNEKFLSRLVNEKTNKEEKQEIEKSEPERGKKLNF